jgi:hypothetical protein
MQRATNHYHQHTGTLQNEWHIKDNAERLQTSAGEAQKSIRAQWSSNVGKESFNTRGNHSVASNEGELFKKKVSQLQLPFKEET